MPENKILSAQMRRYRQEIKKTQEGCSSGLGICTETISLIERQGANPKLSTMMKFANARGISVSQLLQEENLCIVDDGAAFLGDLPEAEALAQNIRRFRKENHLPQDAFADYAGISMRTLSLIECKKTDPRLSTIQKIAAYMGVSVSDLLRVERKSGVP